MNTEVKEKPAISKGDDFVDKLIQGNRRNRINEAVKKRHLFYKQTFYR